MLQVPAGTIVGSEKSATSPEESASSPSSTLAPAPKLRSCAVCRSRKVRCDKRSPCSNCRRAHIACVVPSTDDPPRWARRLKHLNNNATASNAPASHDANMGVDKIMDRLRNLEDLVKELNGQLEQAHAAAGKSSADSPGVSPAASSTQHRDAEHQGDMSSVTNASHVQNQFGRLVLQNAGRSRYVSSGFWSWVNDELHGLKMDTLSLAGDGPDSSEDEASSGKSPSAQELERTLGQGQAFLFGHCLSRSFPDLREFHPLPSQIPFLLDVFSENVNSMMRIVHIPTITKMVRDLRGSDMTRLTPANEALMFSIYYATIISMEEDDIMTNFDASKTDLNLKFRLGLEHALAKADFLNAPDIILVQAFAIFLCVGRRYDLSPRFVWMMTGLVIRMAQYLGLQRDGVHFEHLTPFEIEMRRKVWWIVCHLDLRASEDQGTDLTIISGSFDTKIPLNINDADINTESKELPTERDGVTDMSFPRIFAALCDVMRQMMGPGVRNGAAGLEDQSRMLDQIYQKYEQGYFKYTTESGNIAYWVGVTIARLTMAKMKLIVFLPVLFSSPSEHFSDKTRTELLVSAIEVAEYNHALNAEQACRQWRWLFQTYTHWHAIVFLMIEISRRPWSPIVERAWVALHSSWLIPAQTSMDKKLRIWIPLRQLMAKARKHRDAELERLRADPQAATKLDVEDQKIPSPLSSSHFSSVSSVDSFRERWRQLVAMPERHGHSTQTSGSLSAGLAQPLRRTAYKSEQSARSKFRDRLGDLSSNMAFPPTYLSTSDQQAGQPLDNTNLKDLDPASPTNTPSEMTFGQTDGSSYNPFPTLSADTSAVHTVGLDCVPWLWADSDPSVDIFANIDMDSIDVSMDLNGEMDWCEWVESAKGMEWDTSPSGNGQI